MRHLGRTAALLATITMSLLGLAAAAPAAPAAFAMRIDPDSGSGPATPAATPHGGMAGWEITLIAVGAVIAVTALMWRLRSRPAVHPAAS